MQVADFRKQIQDVLITLTKIARAIDDQAALDEQAASVATSEEKAAIEAKQREARLAAQAQAKAAAEK